MCTVMDLPNSTDMNLQEQNQREKYQVICESMCLLHTVNSCPTSHTVLLIASAAIGTI